MVNPKVISYNGERYAICNIKVSPVYCSGSNIEVEVSEDGLQAFVYFTEPKIVQSATTILGFKPTNGDYNIVHAAVIEALAEKKGHAEGKVKMKLVLDLPFVSEPKTSPDLLGAGTGQRSDIIGIIREPDMASCTGNCVFVFKEIGHGYNASKKAAVHFFEHDQDEKSKSNINVDDDSQQSGATHRHNNNSGRKRSAVVDSEGHVNNNDNSDAGNVIKYFHTDD